MVCFMILNLYFIIYFFKSWFSMSYANVSIFASVALGYALAMEDSQSEVSHHNIVKD